MWETTCFCHLVVPVCRGNEGGFSNAQSEISFGQLLYIVLG